MFQNLDILRLAGAMTDYAATRQARIAENVANADTPGYRARDLPDFATTYARWSDRTEAVDGGRTPDWDTVDAPDQASPNGNTVSVEDQMVKAADTQYTHQLSLAVYGSALSILRASIGAGR